MTSEQNHLLWDWWRHNGLTRPESAAIIHWALMAPSRTIAWGELIADAWKYARRLADQGLRSGQVCAIMLRHRPEFYPLYLGVSLAGGIPAVLAYPNPRLHPDKFRQGLEGMACRSGLDMLLTERDLDDRVRPLIERPDSSIRRLLFPLDWSDEMRTERFDLSEFDRQFHSTRNETDENAPCLLQHSSGTTGLQKGVMLSHRAVIEHLQRYGEVLQVSENDKIASWLPLYHDMGLIAAFQLPLHFGIPIVQLDPFEWVSAPVTLLDAVSREKATMAWLPNFAYNLMADRIHEEDLEGVRLDHLRLLVNCSEPVYHESHEKFRKRFAIYGLAAEALTASYAMAETTFAVTQTRIGEQARILQADRQHLAGNVYRPADSTNAGSRICVSSGRALPGCQIRVVGAGGDELPDGHVGELVISSVSLFDGYHNNPARTQEVLRDGWYRSGDLGFLLDGECYVIGRSKDLIIVAGKNHYPEDIEAVVAEVTGVIPGRVVAFGENNPKTGTEDICVIAETTETNPAQLRSIDLAVKKAGMAISVTISRVTLVPPRWLFKSSSGKPMRKANQERLKELQGAAAA